MENKVSAQGPREGAIARALRALDRAPLFDVEVASACNVHCRFCPRSDMVRGRALMERSTFEAVCRLMPEGAVAMLSGLGDASLHPELSDYVSMLVRRGVSTCIITNGVRLTPALQDRLIAAGLAEVQVSVHGWEDETVREVVVRGARPDLVRFHVERLVGLGGPRVRINFVETANNAHERERVEAWATGLGARFFHRRQHTRGGTIGQVRDDALAPGCGIFSTVTFISADGDVMPCVNDVRGSGRLGHARDVTWNEVLAWKRRVILNGAWFDACHSCDDDYRWVLLEPGGLDDA